MSGRWISMQGYRGLGVSLSRGPQGGTHGIIKDGTATRRGFKGAELGSFKGDPSDLLTSDPPKPAGPPKRRRKSRAKPAPSPPINCSGF